jgi:catechol 2,3-dioxygenase-like lactoylglutathione lyase family enzyme
MSTARDDPRAPGSRPDESSEHGIRGPAPIESISAVTLATHDMARALRFYRALGFPLRYGGESAQFSSLAAGGACLNLIAESSRTWSWWGRIIFHVSDVDALFARAIDQGLHPDAPPCDATWGERYFHITDPDGHELSFAVRLQDPP